MKVPQEIRFRALELVLKYENFPTAAKAVEATQKYINWIMTGDIDQVIKDDVQFYPKKELK